MLKIGLTGGIASGKSTVSNMLRTLSFPIVDADVCAREVVNPGETAYNKIVDVFGEHILLADGTINRKRLGEIIFKDGTKRTTLNGIVHPEVRKLMRKKVEEYEHAGESAVVLDIPLLIESQLLDWVDKVLVVYVPQDIQLNRLMVRDQLTREAAMERIQSQLPLDEKRKYADVLIDNSGTIEETNLQLNDILRKWGLVE
jgi:dephospho-CoA kinase